MRRYLWIALALAGIFLACFGIAEALGVPLLTDPMPALRKAGPLAAAIGVGLLIADVVLPVPSSVIMIVRLRRGRPLRHGDGGDDQGVLSADADVGGDVVVRPA